MAKKCMKTFFQNKKSSQKPFFTIWGQKKIFAEKKVNFAQKSQKNAFFLNSKGRYFGRKQTKSADFVAGRFVVSSSLPQIFFIANAQKFVILSQKNIPPPPKKKALFFWGGGWKLHVHLIHELIGLIRPHLSSK